MTLLPVNPGHAFVWQITEGELDDLYDALTREQPSFEAQAARDALVGEIERVRTDFGVVECGEVTGR